MRAGIFLSCFFLLLGTFLNGETHHFIGIAGCKQCHKGAAQGNQFEIWEQTNHAKAFETLKSEAAAKIAKEKGLKASASEASECLECHVTGAGADPILFESTFDRTQGVQCESCHGAGYDYRGMLLMKDYDVAISKGLNPIKVADGSAEKLCRTCHNEKNPTFKGFNFDSAWHEIEHPRLKK